ncbi:Fatty acid oxidation complex subunit alpha [Paraburkholderia caffeinitolerans]|uniref:Fatty acid oxidation complex subunit alpha n=1 Tax=Paraburkholderia caffeinitolerans TaxID=1723730 RepID=A0A6J5FHT4_9BURK|nr:MULTISPECIES: enoyl-CoA hydratase/isomerase family protein [Paraburkholderia]CAB3778493.1 Fatty acid oxidation complex subunit alpha [Paraburkholderia caffeinitolerans]
MSEDSMVYLRKSRIVLRDGIAEFSHQSPESRNALGAALRADYRDMLDWLDNRRDVRALILTGSGGSFCSGADLKETLGDGVGNAPEDSEPADVAEFILNVHAWLQRLRELELPVIAAVDGPAAGAGFSLALAADFVLASQRAVFCLSFARIGLIPDLAALHQLPRIVGLSAAKDMVMTARKVGAVEARALGIVHEIHEAEALNERAWHFAARFRQAPREATAIAKRLLNGSFETSYRDFVGLEASGQARAAAALYSSEAVAAFTSGKPLRFDWDRG